MDQLETGNFPEIRFTSVPGGGLYHQVHATPPVGSAGDSVGTWQAGNNVLKKKPRGQLVARRQPAGGGNGDSTRAGQTSAYATSLAILWFTLICGMYMYTLDSIKLQV